MKAANVADHAELLTEIQPRDVKLGQAAHELRYDHLNEETLQLLMEAFPSHTFLQGLTENDLGPLAKALQEAYAEDVEAHKNIV